MRFKIYLKIKTKDFDNRVEINKVSDKLQETKENILKEIKKLLSEYGIIIMNLRMMIDYLRNKY